MRNTASLYVLDYCKKHSEGFLVTGDAGFGVWDNFQKEIPDQYINPGINEAATIGLAAGMALSGRKVFVYNIIPFLIMRCYEQVRIDVCYQNLPVIFIGIGSGITYAPSGMTHYSVEDIALAATCPNMNIISPSDPNQVKNALDFAVKSDKPTFIRLSKAGEPNITDEKADITKPCVIRKTGSKKAVIFHGSISDAVIAAGEKTDCDIYSMPFIKPYNIKEMNNLVSQYERVFIVEEHYSMGGLFTLLRNDLDDPAKLRSIAIPNEPIHVIGGRDYVRKHYGIDAESIAKKIEQG